MVGLCVCVSLFVGQVGVIGWLRQTCGTLKGACASWRWGEVVWSWSACVGEGVFVSCKEVKN